jgi:hypothetical protein
MQLDIFKYRYPEFKFKAIVKKRPLEPVYLRNVVNYLMNWLDEEGIEWKRQANADPEYYVFWFKNAKYATMFSLKWS